MKSLILIFTGLICGLLAGCASPPAPAYNPAPYETPSADFEILKRRLIRTAAALMRANAELCPNTRIITAAEGTFPICTNKVAIEDSPVKNAQTNGNTILVTTAMIAALNNDELAFLIAHELAHSVEGDYAQTHSRPPLELKADRTGLFLMARAGYDIEAARSALHLLGIPQSPATDTHPSGPQRMANLKKSMAEVRQALNVGAPLLP